MFKFLKKPLIEIPDSWTVAHMGDDRCCFIRINSGLADFTQKGSFPYFVAYKVPLEQFELPEIQMRFEDHVFEIVQSAERGVVFAIVTNALTRDFLCYVRKPSDAAHYFKSLKTAFPATTIESQDSFDAQWSVFDELQPK